MGKLLLIDGHSILNRAYYGLPELTNSAGLHTNAILGFLNILMKIMEEEQPTHICVAFDVHQPTFRHLRYEAYKGTRKPMPEELREQVPVMKEVLHSMQIRTIEQGGFEADDILGTLSRMGDAAGYRVTIVSGDRDLLQLATDDILVRIPKTKQSGTTIEDYYAKDVVERYQVTPVEFIDLKGLMGDTSDNIPGVPGIGEKTAIKIITEYKSIENAYAHIEDIKPNKARENLKEYYEQALLSKELATIKLDCELQISIDDLQLQELFNEESYELFKKLELKSILKRFDQPVAPKDYQPILQMIAEEAVNDTFWNTLCHAKALAIQCVEGQEGLLGLTYSITEGQAGLLRISDTLTEERLTDKLAWLYHNCENLITIGCKRQLHLFQGKVTDGKVLDLAVACYLLNPLKDSYLYDDIARDILSLTVPSRQELLGKEPVTAMTMESKSVQAYLAYEVCIALSAAEEVTKRLNTANMLELYYQIECPTIFSLYEMEKNGIRVKREALLTYGDQLVGRIQELEKEIHALAGKDFNILSPKQLGEVLFEDLSLPGAKKTKTGYSTNVEVLEKIRSEHPIIPAILEYRQLTKLKSTYADGLANYIDADERIRSQFHQTITATGRISSTEPNLQNIPIRMELGRMIRKVFIPEQGYVFVDADYSQIELRLLAHLSQDPVLIRAFRENMDIHASTASEVFGIPIDQITPLERRNAKAVNFGIVYGISAFGLSQDLNISRREAQEFIDQYFATYPMIHAYLNSQVEMAKNSGKVETMYHRVRPVPELKSANYMQRSFGERVAMNSPIQGTAADIIKIAMNHVRERLAREQLKSRLILQIHDELLIEAYAPEVEQVKTILQEEMMHAAELSVPLSIDVHVADNWYDAK